MSFSYTASIRHDACFEECGQNGESETTFPITINVGETNSAVAISSARSFSSAKIWKIFRCRSV